jgi:predicted nucleotidyltransferase
MIARDRDYLVDASHTFFKVVGDYHPETLIVSYVKYFPSSFGTRLINGQRFGYNSFVPKSFTLSPHQRDRICFSPYHGGIVPCIPQAEVKTVFHCQERLQAIWQQKERYQRHPVGQELISFLEAIDDHVDIAQLGVTGSFLLDCATESSDIDLVCYGWEAYRQMDWIFHKSDVLIPYTDEAYARRLYTRRMISMAPMNFDLLLLQETRKFQGVTRHRHIHLNCQPLRNLAVQTFFADLSMVEVGEISCIAEIVDDREGIYAPALYMIRVVDILDSLFYGEEIRHDVRAMISFMGAYANSFRKGDRVFLQGKMVQVQKSRSSEIFYGVELTPWNTSRTFRANLLSPGASVSLIETARL